MLRAYPIAVGPSVPARFVGRLDGSTVIVTVTVDDTVQHQTVVRGPVIVRYGDEPRLGPCPICRRPVRSLHTTLSTLLSALKRWTSSCGRLFGGRIFSHPTPAQIGSRHASAPPFYSPRRGPSGPLGGAQRRVGVRATTGRRRRRPHRQSISRTIRCSADSAGDRSAPSARAFASTTSPSTRRIRRRTTSASPSSGVVKTVNNGTTFEPIFDTYGSASIADITLAPSDPNILYVATGEANNRQTTSYGDGLYKSTDAGKTFTNIGFKDAQTLGRVIVHPRDPNTVWIAVGGHLYGAERRARRLHDDRRRQDVDEDALRRREHRARPSSSSIRAIRRTSGPRCTSAQRTAWGFNGGGQGQRAVSEHRRRRAWKKVTGGGLPRGTMGRIALDICKTQPNVIYAQIEVAPDKEPQTAATSRWRRRRQAAAGGRGGRRWRRWWWRWWRRTRRRRAAAESADAPASGARRTRVARGRSCRTRISARCTSARFASIRTTGRRLPRRRRSDEVGRRRAARGRA